MLANMLPFDRWPDADLLAFDMETTGVDRFSDVPVSFALVVVRHGTVVWERSSVVDPGRDIPSGATAVHGITSERARAEGISLRAAVCDMAGTLLRASRQQMPIVGMKLDFDLTMLDACYRGCTGRGLCEEGFAGPVLDVLVLDRHFDRYRKGRRTLGDLCAEYGVRIDHAHDARSDAVAAVGVVAEMSRRYRVMHEMTPETLHRAQVGWHREWVASFSSWRTARGMAPLDERDAVWPISPSEPAPAAEDRLADAI
jgi:DNA polymerase-3 subunit epsilon